MYNRFNVSDLYFANDSVISLSKTECARPGTLFNILYITDILLGRRITRVY